MCIEYAFDGTGRDGPGTTDTAFSPLFQHLCTDGAISKLSDKQDLLLLTCEKLYIGR